MFLVKIFRFQARGRSGEPIPGLFENGGLGLTWTKQWYTGIRYCVVEKGLVLLLIYKSLALYDWSTVISLWFECLHWKHHQKCTSHAEIWSNISLSNNGSSVTCDAPKEALFFTTWVLVPWEIIKKKKRTNLPICKLACTEVIKEQLEINCWDQIVDPWFGSNSSVWMQIRLG